MSWSIRIEVKELNFNPFDPIKLEKRINHELDCFQSTYNESGLQVLKTLKNIAEAYNYDGSDTMTDYFDVNFYLQVNFDWEKEKEWMQEILN